MSPPRPTPPVRNRRSAKAPAAAALALPAALSIREVSTVAPTLAAAIAAGASVLDSGAVSIIDTAGLQLLLSARRTAAALGVELRLAAPSAAVKDSARSLGFAAALGLEPEPAS